MKPKLSIIIVHYHASEELFSCLSSIKASGPKVSYETIVVDNDEKQKIDKLLKKKFAWVKYVRAPGNIGFGAGNNLGAKAARGKYLFILNPDTRVQNNAIDILLQTVKSKTNVGIAAPQLLDENINIYPFQGTGKLTPLAAIFSLTIINKIFPRNPLAEKYWIKNWNRKSLREVESIEGSAFMIKKQLFNKLEGFDENFFLYFEETDLCTRLRKQGLKILINPKAKVIHLSARSTEDEKKAIQIFRQSRSIFFDKHFGRFRGSITRLLFWVLDRWRYLAMASLAAALSSVILYKSSAIII